MVVRVIRRLDYDDDEQQYSDVSDNADQAEPDDPTGPVEQAGAAVALRCNVYCRVAMRCTALHYVQLATA
jgi:hypothetical protein